MKICSLCKIDKSDEDFYFRNKKKDILRSACKSCALMMRKPYEEKNKDKINKRSAIHYQQNKERKQVLRKNNKDKRSLIDKNRRQNEPTFRIRQNISNMINVMLKANNTSKHGKSCVDYLSYTMQELKTHLEKQFESWMTWSNHGKYDPKVWDDNDSTTWTWQIDHIIPHSEFLYTTMNSQCFNDCWALCNLRPYSAKQNIIDGKRK